MAVSAPLDIALVGAGKIARWHLPVLCQLPGVRVSALADPQAGRVEELAGRFGIERRLDSYLPLLEGPQPDAVFVLVSILHTAEVAASFIAAGIPTFIEKPPGLYTEETRRLAALARERGALVMVGLNRRFYSTLLQGRQLLLEAGPVRSVAVEAQGEPQQAWQHHPPEVVRRWCAANDIHALDLLRFFGGEVRRVQALQRCFEGPGPDACAALVEFAGGGLGRAVVEWTAPGKGHRVEAWGPGVTLAAGWGMEQVQWWRRGQEARVLELDEEDRRFKPGFWRQDQCFVECVRHGRPLPFPACDLEDALRTMELVDQISGTA